MAGRRGTIWSNLRWVHPQRTSYGTGSQALRDKLRYFTYRDDRDTPAPRGGRRWVDCGLGGTYGDILKHCQALSSEDRLAWTLVISPKPRLLALIEDEAERRTFVENLTEEVVENWFAARGFGAAEFAYVLHDRATNTTGESQMHSHVILPGTVESGAGRERFQNRPSDLRAFNLLVEETFEEQLDQTLGLAWRGKWREIQREEALRKHWETLEWGEIPANLPELAEQLHSSGYEVGRIPESIRSAAEFETWLSAVEEDGADLDVWFGRSL